METTNKNIYLLKMGCDTQNGLNHRIRFTTRNWSFEGEQVNVCIDFEICTPYAIKKTKKGNSKTIYAEQDSGLYVDFCYTNSKGSFGLNHILKDSIKADLDYFEAPFDRYLKYNYENILKIINFLLNTNYENIVLLDINYVKEFNYNNFFSDEYIHDQESYEKAVAFKEFAQAKIKEIKSESRYDNSSYSYEGDLFKITVHYNCYNDYLLFDLTHWTDAVKQINDYVIPEDKIKRSIISHGISSSRLY